MWFVQLVFLMEEKSQWPENGFEDYQEVVSCDVLSCLDFLTVAFWLDGLADDPGWRLWGFPINCRFSYHGVPVPRFKFNASTLLKGKTGVLTP